jgi:hypothetical protein
MKVEQMIPMIVVCHQRAVMVIDYLLVKSTVLWMVRCFQICVQNLVEMVDWGVDLFLVVKEC